MKNRKTPLPWILSAIAILVLAASELISAWWQPEETPEARRRFFPGSFTYVSPRDESVSVQHLPIEASQVGFLTYDRGRRVAILDRNASRGMELLYLEYNGKSPRYFFDLFNHPPERCMASTGSEVTERHPNREFQMGDHRFLIQELKTESPGAGGSRFIFKAIWIHPNFPLDYSASIHAKRIQAAIATVPTPPARLMMAGLHGFDSREEAWEFFEKYALAQLRPAGDD